MSTGGASTADKVKYNNTESGLQSTDVQGAIDEVNSSLIKYNPTTDWFEYTYNGVTKNVLYAGFKWDGTLFKNGDMYSDKTGGWETYANSGYSISFNPKLAWTTTNSGAHFAIGTVNKIDITPFSKLNCTIDACSEVIFFLWNDKPISSDTWQNINIKAATRVLTNSAGILTIDVSTYSGEYYIGFGDSGIAYSGTVSKVWLE